MSCTTRFVSIPGCVKASGMSEKYSATFGGRVKFSQRAVFIDFAKQNQ